MSRRDRGVLLAISLLWAWLFLIMIVVSVWAQEAEPRPEHRHPPADVPLHEKFYSTWYMPDEPMKSCCNMKDCYPTRAEWRDGQWFAERREDHLLIPVPWGKFETNRSSPDGRSHLCAHEPSAPAAKVNPVLCFVLGGGT